MIPSTSKKPLNANQIKGKSQIAGSNPMINNGRYDPIWNSDSLWNSDFPLIPKMIRTRFFSFELNEIFKCTSASVAAQQRKRWNRWERVPNSYRRAAWLSIELWGRFQDMKFNSIVRSQGFGGVEFLDYQTKCSFKPKNPKRYSNEQHGNLIDLNLGLSSFAFSRYFGIQVFDSIIHQWSNSILTFCRHRLYQQKILCVPSTAHYAGCRSVAWSKMSSSGRWMKAPVPP